MTDSFPDIVMIPVVEIDRLEEHNSFGTFGALKINKSVFCATLEPADLLNKPNVSSIPAQQYICTRFLSPKFGYETFKVLDVPGRTDILFHPGVEMKHTHGCILLGQYWDKFKGNRALANSGDTFKRFMAVMKDVKSFHLTIHEHY